MEKSIKGILHTPEHFDVIIIGTGIAGMFTALSIQKKLKILMITKETLKRSTSHLAQGGIASPIFGDRLYEDTLRAGGYVNDPKRVRILVEEGQRQIGKLIHWGVPFERDQEGNLLATREGGHSEKNILHCKDETGKKIMTVLEKELRKNDRITILEETYVYRLKSFAEKKGSGGGKVFSMLCDGESKEFCSPNIVLATGGIGGIFEYTSNPEGNTGDGIALGNSLGAATKNMDFNQFHPTYFHGNGGDGFLVTEALRGEGAVLRNVDGKAFMNEKHPMGDLAPRDVVARGIVEELQRSGKGDVSLDSSHMEKEFIKQRFPKIYRKALQRGFDITKAPLPVRPVSHYMMGGIAVDEIGETSIPGVYAVGECACTDVHGANRLASNSLLEAIVFGGRAAKNISETFLEKNRNDSEQRLLLDCNRSAKPKEGNDFSWSVKELKDFQKALKKETQKVLGIIKEDGLLREFYSDQELALRMFDGASPPKNWTVEEKRVFYEVNNQLIVTCMMTKAALERNQNIGAHYKVQGKDNSPKRRVAVPLQNEKK